MYFNLGEIPTQALNVGKEKMALGICRATVQVALCELESLIQTVSFQGLVGRPVMINCQDVNSAPKTKTDKQQAERDGDPWLRSGKPPAGA
jgi:hypothetical protein